MMDTLNIDECISDLGMTPGELLACMQNEDDTFSVRFCKSGKLSFIQEWNEWRKAEIDDKEYIVAIIGKVKHKKFSRDIGIAFTVENKKFIKWFLVECVKSKVHLNNID